MKAGRSYRLAEWYREFAAGGLPYGRIAEVVAREIRAVVPGAARVLEVACGTGNLTIPLAQQGFSVAGLDRSPEMVELARRRSRAAGAPVEFACGDLREADGEADAVVCFYGGLNYLRTPGELRAGLAATRRVLRPGGAFVFDQFTDRRMRRLFDGSARAVTDRATVTTRSRCLPDGRIAQRVTVERDGTRHVELHRLRIHADLHRQLGEAGLEVVACRELSAALGGCLHLAEDYLYVTRRVGSSSG